jgi:hypothetical protein
VFVDQRSATLHLRNERSNVPLSASAQKYRVASAES